MNHKTTLRQMYDSRASLQALADMELDLAPSFLIAKNVDVFNTTMGLFDKERKKLFRRAYSVVPAEGEPGTLNEGFTKQSVNDQVDELLDQEVDVEVTVLKLSRLTSGGAPIQVKPSVLSGVVWMIDNNLPEA